MDIETTCLTIDEVWIGNWIYYAQLVITVIEPRTGFVGVITVNSSILAASHTLQFTTVCT
jgi:hypothetical protein